MDQQTVSAAASSHARLPRWELIAMAAALMSLNALAVDIMLPGLQEIGASLGEPDENRRQLVITAYLTGFGVAQIFLGPISDRFGRRVPLLCSLAVYMVAALACVFVPSFGAMLALRFVQGLGAAATRVVTVSVVRDQFGGRAMAEVMSLVFMVFMVIPIVAPGIGQVIMLGTTWPAIFLFMAVVALIFTVWAYLRLPETLREEYRRPLTARVIVEGFRIVVTNRTAICYTLALAIIFGALFGFINSSQQIYVGLYDVGAMFPVYFAIVAGMMAVMSFLNSRLVGRFGMRRLAHSALLLFIITNFTSFLLALAGPVPLWLFLGMFMIAMSQFALIGSNFNALAMEPLGHVAGTASSVQGFTQTVIGGLIGALIGQAYDGTVLPLSAGYFLLSLGSLCLVLIAERGRLFRQVSQPI